MKTYTRTKTQGQQGNTLMTTIMITGLIGFILAVYLTLVQSQNRATFRSQAWNMAMPVVEAGIEDALAHINANYEVGLDRDGWTQSGGTYTITRTVGDCIYTARITNYTMGSLTNSSPIIDSFGYVQMPGAMAKASTTLLAAAGGTVNSTVAYLGRGVRVQAIPDFIFGRGMVAKDSIDINGNNIRTDSFDSMDPAYSTNGGKYWPGHTKDHGDIAVNSGLTNSLSLGSANIWGNVSTGPGGTVAIGPNGAVGDNGWHAAGNDGIQTGHSKDDMNVSFPDAKVPWEGGFAVNGGWLTNIVSTSTTNASSITSIPYPVAVLFPITTNLVTSALWPLGSPGPIATNWNNKHTRIDSYTFPTFRYSVTNIATTLTTNRTYYDCLIGELDGGDYLTATLSGSVYIAAPVRMYVTTTLNISDLIIKPGGSLKLYTSAASASLAGNNSANSDGTADAFSYWGLPSNTSVTFSGNAKFIGTIYAPNADFTMNGTGHDTYYDFSGASITKTARLNGHFNFHYDEALGRMGPFRGYIIDQWIEMPPSSVPRLNLTGYGSTGGTTGGGTTGGGTTQIQ